MVMHSDDQLSTRGRQLLEAPPFPEYLLEHFQRAGPANGADSRPEYIGLCVAENKLMWDLLQPKMLQCRDIPQRVLAYDAMTGALDFRCQLAGFLGRSFLTREPAPELDGDRQRLLDELGE